MGVSGALFWVGGGRWGIILGEWGGWGLSWVGGARWVGVGALFHNAPFKYSNWNIQLSLT